MTPLRRAAEAAEEASGLRAEIIRGVLMMFRTPCGKHAGTINDLCDRLRPQLPPHLDTFQMASLPLPGDPDDYATPDLLVCDAGFGDSDDWLADPADVELTVEVVSKGNSTKDTRDMVAWYAEAGVPAYLVVDPRDGSWTLYTHPRGGEYQARRHGLYGEDVAVPGLDVKIATAGFARYA
jgi:Uma2 family endonuclease